MKGCILINQPRNFKQKNYSKNNRTLFLSAAIKFLILEKRN